MNLKELEKLAKLCHKVGIQSITLEGVTLTLAQGFIPNTRLKKAIDKASDIESEPEYTEEQILNWSSTPV